jgi:hypothetical protein
MNGCKTKQLYAANRLLYRRKLFEIRPNAPAGMKAIGKLARTFGLLVERPLFATVTILRERRFVWQ